MRIRLLDVAIPCLLLLPACEVDSKSAGNVESTDSEAASGSEEGGGACEGEVFADDFDRSCAENSDCVAVFEGPSDDACRECAFSAINVAEQPDYVAALGPLSCSAGPCGADCIQGHLGPAACVDEQCELGLPFICGAGDSGGSEENTVPCNGANAFCIGLEPNNYACVPLPEPCAGSTDCACLTGSGEPDGLDACLEQGSCTHDGRAFQVRCPDG